MKFIIAAMIVFSGMVTFGQVIDNTAVHKSMGADQYIRLHYENDYFSKTDIYYSQGISLEFVHPKLKNFAFSYALIRSKKKEGKYGVSIEHSGFTPTSISHSQILFGDRPFASCLFLKTFSIVNDSIKKYRITSALSTGIIGPGAGGGKFQAAIHRWINDESPLGWDNQIKNDLILNYHVTFEKRVISYKRNFLATLNAAASAGSLQNKFAIGTTLMAGSFDDPFLNFSKRTRKFQVSIFTEPRMSLIGYDATLQGGVFNRSSVYRISADEVTRIVFQNHAGLIIRMQKFTIEYFQSYVTKEFKTGEDHYWGGLRLGLIL